MLKGLQTIEDMGTFVLSLGTRYKCGQREPGGCGTGAEKWLQPQLQSCGRGMEHQEKLSSERVTRIAVRRGSLEKHGTGIADQTVER